MDLGIMKKPHHQPPEKKSRPQAPNCYEQRRIERKVQRFGVLAERVATTVIARCGVVHFL
jgi:hypothetical protein